MNELERHEAAANRSKREDMESRAARARTDIDAATSDAKASLKKAKHTAEEAYDDVRQQARGAFRQTRAKVSDLRRHAPGSPEAARQKIAEFIDGNPAMVAVAGIAAGLLVGALLPGTKREDQMFGRYADDAKDESLRYARDLVEQGRHFIEDSFDEAREASREKA